MKTKVKDRPYLIPSYFQILHDEDLSKDQEDPVEMANHFNDIYKLYLRRLAEFEMKPEIDQKLENELVSILSELIRVKKALQA